jgi:predicted ATPase
MALSAGSRLAQYEILSPLGAGGMGEVYRARDTRLGREVAVKILPVLRRSDPSGLERFTREACLASALNHPNIVTVHEIADSDFGSFIVMELIVGQTLRGAREVYSSPERVLPLAVQVAKALAVAHGAGIVHRDLKPENIMVREDGYVKVLDFGLATANPEPGPDDSTVLMLTGAGEVLGTVPYMSPEQARGETMTGASDIFSFGVVLYELLAHRHPFRATSAAATLNAIIASVVPPPSQLDPAIPPELDSLILRMIEKNAAIRPSAAELAEELDSLAAGKKFAAPRRGSGTAPSRPVAGRDKERAGMFAALEAAAAGHGSLLCLAGEAGEGKTTLAEDFLSRLPEQYANCLIARGRCSERLAGSDACLPFLEALEGLHRTGGIAGRLLPTLAPTWFAQIASDKSLPDGPSPERLKWEIGRFLDELSKHRPIVLFLDDLHWAGVATVDLIAYLGTRLGSLRILVVATYRPGDLLRERHPFVPVRLDLEGRGLCREIRAALLDRAAVEEYLQLEFPGHAFPPSFAASIHARTEGNPLFMVDLLRYLRDRGAITSPEGVWTLNEFAADFERDLPASVRSMVERKIGQIPEADQKLLDAASVQGQEFDSAVVARVLGAPADEVEDRLDTLDNVHTIVRQVEVREFPDRTMTLRYRFVHVLYQNALYTGIRPTRKATLSAAVAKALLEFHGDRSEALASELALLFESARDFCRAIDYFEIAARHAVRLYANREAVTFLRSALRLLHTLPHDRDRDSREFALQAALGPPLVVTRGHASPETEEAYTRAWDLSRGLGKTEAHFDVLFGMWNFHEVSGRLRVAGELADELLALAEDGGEASRLLLAHRAVANVALWTGDPRKAKVHFERALSFYLPEFHREAIRTGVAPGMGCLGMLGWTEWLLGNPDQALCCIEKQLEMAREISHPFTTAISLVDASFLYQFRDDHAAARKASEDLMRLAVGEGFALWQAGSRVIHGWAIFHLGERKAGLAEMRQGIEQWRATGAEVASTYYLSLLAANQGLAGDTTGGLATVDAALSRIKETGEAWWKPGLLLVKGDLLAANEPAAAKEAWIEAFELARSAGAKAFELRAAERLG